MKALSENLKRLRESRNVSKSELGRLLNIAPSAYSVYETGLKNVGDREPNLKNLIKLADFFKVSVDELLNHHVDEFERCKSLWESAGFEVEITKWPADIFIPYIKKMDYEESELKKDSNGDYTVIKVWGLKKDITFPKAEKTGLEFFTEKEFIEWTNEVERVVQKNHLIFLKDVVEMIKAPRVYKSSFTVPRIKLK